MKRINYGGVDYLVGDEIADLLVHYTARLASNNTADAVEVRVLGPDGNSETATFALGGGITMTAETTRSELQEPDNAPMSDYITQAMDALTPSQIQPMTAEDLRAAAQEFEPEL